MKMGAIKPVVKISAETQTTENLRNYILSGALRPGERLTEMSLAEQLGVARATLRASLNRLVTEGVVVLTPYTGWHVTSLTAEDVWELWTLRGSLEGLAARLAAGSMTQGLRTRIGEAMSTLADACRGSDVETASEADFALHRVVIEGVDHRRLQKQYLQVEQQIRLYIRTSNALVGGDLRLISEQHEPLVEALMRADPAAAAAEAWRHSETEGKKLVSWLQQQEGAAPDAETGRRRGPRRVERAEGVA